MKKSTQLLKGPVGRALVIAEVVTLIGGGIIFYKLTDDQRYRDAMEAKMPLLMKGFHQITSNRYATDAGASPSTSSAADK